MIFRQFNIFLILLLLVSCQQEKRKLVQIGESVVTVEEFQTRYAITPYFSAFPEGDSQTKLMVLAALIGEKVLANEARELNFHEREKFKTIQNQLQKEALIEELLNELYSGIEISQEDIRTAQRQTMRELEIEELVFESEVEAQNYRNSVDTNQPFNVQHPEIESATYNVKWGNSEPKIENVLWKLRAGEVSAPVNFQGHSYLFRISKEKIKPFLDDFASREQTEKMLYKREKKILYRTYFKKIMAGKKTSVPGGKLKYIASQLEDIFDIPQSDSVFLNPILMTDSYYQQAQGSLQDKLTEDFITFDDGSQWSMGDFLRNLRYGAYPLNYSSRKVFRASLRNTAIIMMEHEYLAKEARKRGLQSSAYVIEETRKWMDSYLADQMRLELIAGTNGNNSDTDIKAKRIIALDNFLAKGLSRSDISVDKELLDKTEIRHLKMLVFKTHFPGRQLAPSILPLDRLPVFLGTVHKMVAGRN